MSVVQLRLILDFAPGSSSLSYKLHIVINNNCHILKNHYPILTKLAVYYACTIGLFCHNLANIILYVMYRPVKLTVLHLKAK